MTHRVEAKLDRELRSGVLALLIMAAVKELGKAYGYQIGQAVARASGGRLKLNDGTLYPLLRFLARHKLVTSYWGEPRRGPPRRYYRLTPEGESLLEAGLARWRELTATTEQTLKGLAFSASKEAK